MKYLPSIFTTVFSGKMGKQNVRLLLRYIFVLALLISFYSIIFHYLMAAEGQKHSWITGFYWVLVVMSTLGFGDITFTSDVGRLFSIIVLASGVIFFLIFVTINFIKLFFAP
ncbi:MAG: ion channel, partial [Smithellaceae bacterium]